MSRKTLPKITVAPSTVDEYHTGTTDLFPREDHPDHRTVGEWRNACAIKAFEKKYGPIEGGNRLIKQIMREVTPKQHPAKLR